MLINSLSLENFKCFERLDVKFAPITLLTGANSSGKSSLISAILAVLQTDGLPFYLSTNGKYVNMGSFEEMTYDKKNQSKMKISIKPFVEIYSCGKPEFNWTWKFDQPNDLPKLEYLSLEFEKNRLERVGELNKARTVPTLL